VEHPKTDREHHGQGQQQSIRRLTEIILKMGNGGTFERGREKKRERKTEINLKKSNGRTSEGWNHSKGQQ